MDVVWLVYAVWMGNDTILIWIRIVFYEYIFQEEYTDLSELRKEMESGYNQNALNCWIAALLYLVTLCFSVQQFWMNNRSTYRWSIINPGEISLFFIILTSSVITEDKVETNTVMPNSLRTSRFVIYHVNQIIFFLGFEISSRIETPQILLMIDRQYFT